MRTLLTLCLLASASLATAAPRTEKVSWTEGGTKFDGVLVWDDATADKRPGLLMVPNWYGVNDSAIGKAKTIAGRAELPALQGLRRAWPPFRPHRRVRSRADQRDTGTRHFVACAVRTTRDSGTGGAHGAPYKSCVPPAHNRHPSPPTPPGAPPCARC